MPFGMLPIVILVAIIVVYVIAKVRYYMRRSDQEWAKVDKSKLREWTDDED